jgi:predicted dehydrogenase
MKKKMIQVGLGALGLTGFPFSGPGAQRGWAEIVKESKDWEPVAYVDVDEERLRIARKRFGIPKEKLFVSLEEAIEKVPADAVLIVTPTKYHAPAALAAIKAGLHVLVEKPFADSLAKAKEITKKAEEKKVKLMVDQNYRFMRGAITVKKLLKNALVGDLGYVTFNKERASYRYRGWRDETEDMMLVNSGIHSLDKIRAVTNLNPIDVIASRWRPKWSWIPGYTTVTAVFRMENDIMFSYHESASSLGQPCAEWRFEGSKGTIMWDDEESVTASLTEPAGTLQCNLIPMELEERPCALHEFAESIRDGREPEASGRDNLLSLAMLFAAIESAKTGKLVKIKNLL